MKALTLSAAVLTVAALAGCRGQTSHEAPIVGIRNMYDQPRYEIQSESDFFPDHRTMRPLVDGVVSTEQETDPGIATGRLEDQTGYVLEIPDAVVKTAFDGSREKMLARGKARFNIYCTPCHDATGNGQGAVRRHALATGAAAFAPSSFHQDRLRHMPDGQLFATITNGKSNMPPYGMQIPVSDRWAIVSYVRALQVANPKMEVAQ
jgi:mono/diheme cytochrome c family protein